MAQKNSIWRSLGLNSISWKIILGFISIYIFFIISAAFNIYIIQGGVSKISDFSVSVNPSIDQVDELRLMLNQSQTYTINWVKDSSFYRPQDRKSLQELHLSFPEVKDRLTNLIRSWEDRSQVKLLQDTILPQFEELNKYQQSIMELLPEERDYQEAQLLDSANALLYMRIFPIADRLSGQLKQISNQKKRNRQSTEVQIIEQFEYLNQVIIILASVLILFGFFVSWWTRRQIVRPIKYINSVFVKLGTGELPEDKHFYFNDDEIGEMATSADKLVYSLRQTSLFAENIGDGNYQADFKPLSEKDVLGNALLEMRDNLATVAEEDRRRSWSTEGLVKFSELLKENNNDIDQLADSIISNLVLYLKANQGGLFIVENADPDVNQNGEEPYMRLVSCYAWDKKKYLEQKIYKGDGLNGQAWQEQSTIYLTEVPDGYVQITSGLGEANPNCILIVPLKLNEEVFGVVELASFNNIEPYEIEFVEKIAESIASTVATVRINERTKKLLSESTMMTEQMKSQEEEMRMNMEELQSTQEHIEQAQLEIRAREQIFSSSNMILETDLQFYIQKANDLASIILKYDPNEFEDMAVEYLFANYDIIELAKDRLKMEDRWSDFVYIKGKNNQRIYTKALAGPIRNDAGEVIKFLFLFDDLSQLKS